MVIEPLDEATRPEITRAALARFAPVSDERAEVGAGAHRVVYRCVSEIRFGPALYEATVEGPRGRSVGKFLRGRRLLYRGAEPSPYHDRRDWFVFVEQDERAERTVFHVFDLGSGQLRRSHPAGRAALFVGWRGETAEFVCGVYEAFRDYSWHAVDSVGGRSRPVGRGGFEPYLTADGRHLLVLDTRSIHLALFDLASGQQLAQLTAADLRQLVRGPETLEVVAFDAAAGRLTVMLNWRRADWRTGHVEYERAISISIARGRDTAAVPPPVA